MQLLESKDFLGTGHMTPEILLDLICKSLYILTHPRNLQVISKKTQHG